MILVLGAFPLAAAAGGPESPPGQEDPTRFVVGVYQIPAGRGPGDDFHGGKILRVDSSINFLVVEAQSPNAFGAKARADKNTRYVHEDPVLQLIQEAPDPRFAESIRDRVTPPVSDGPTAQFTPNDPQYGSQYGPQQIRANLAWDTTLGSTSAAVCVIDTGVRYTHEDLTGARWLGGHDYVNSDTDPDDDHGHGTHVTGTAAAAINNAVGIAGIGNVGFYHVKALSASGSGTWSDVASAVTWCADNTMPRTVISLSLGGSAGAPVLESAVDYAYNTKGKLIVAASGNNGCTGAGCIGYPAAYPEVVAVTCTTNTETKCSFSSSGPEAEIAAPGNNILSTAAPDLPTFNCGGGGSLYSTCSGTSMSTPHVSGAAALVWSHTTGHTNTGLRQCLQDTAQDLGPAGWDQEYGHGEVDAKSLLDAGTSCGSGGGGDVIWEEDFDSGSIPGWGLSGLWRITNCRSSSSPNSLGYNTGPCPPNYDVGTTTGNAITPSINIPAGSTNVKLNWDSWHQTESGTTWDKKIVSISDNGGLTWTQLWQEDGTQGTWNARSEDISSYAGSTVKVRFHFDSVDGVANTGEGWYVDDVSITGTTPGAGFPYEEDFDSGSAPGWTPSGLWRVTSCRSFTPLNSLGYNTGPCPPNYDVGATSGDAVSPAISIPASASNVKLEWMSWHQTEFGTTWDKKIVYISDDGGLTWTQLWQEDGTQGVWNARSVDISSYAGSTVKVRFHFDSVDGVANTGEGWYVDSVKVHEGAAVVPGAPQNLNAVAGPGAGQIKLTWQAPASDGGTPITSYKVYRALSSGGPYSHIATVGGSTLTYTDSGLPNGATRHYRVSAVNLVGEGPQSLSDSATTFTTPTAPRNLDAVAGPGVGQIKLTWQAPLNNGGTAVTSYKVYRSTSFGGSYVHIATVGGSTLTYTDGGLGNGVTRFYRVSAVNLVGEGPQSNTDSATTFTTPSAPQNLEADPGPGVGQISLSWSPPASNGGTPVTSYQVWRNDGSGFFFLASTGGTSYTDSGLSLLKTYHYFVVAVNMVGPGPASNTACTKPFPWEPLGVVPCSVPLSGPGLPGVDELLAVETEGRVEEPSHFV